MLNFMDAKLNGFTVAYNGHVFSFTFNANASGI